jgi:hypothetical protein
VVVAAVVLAMTVAVVVVRAVCLHTLLKLLLGVLTLLQ